MTQNEIGRLICSLKNGDEVSWNDRCDWFKVVGVSEHFVLAWLERKRKAPLYTIISKVPYGGVGRNGVGGDDFFCGPDDRIFGFYKGYHFKDYEWVKEYMKELEYGEINISARGMVPLRALRVKSGE